MEDKPPGDAHLVLVHPEIHWNTGNTGRTCLAFGARLHLIEPLGFSLEARQVRRAGLDYWARVPLDVHPSWEAFEALLPDLGEPWFLSTAGTRALHEVRLTAPAVFVLGCESAGLPGAIRKRWRERLVRIPQRPGSVRSLNQSTVAALVLYELRRREAREWAGRGGSC